MFIKGGTHFYQYRKNRLSPSTIRHKFDLINAVAKDRPAYAAKILFELSRATFRAAVKAFDDYYRFRSSFVHKIMAEENSTGLLRESDLVPKKTVTLVCIRLDFTDDVTTKSTLKRKLPSEFNDGRDTCESTEVISVKRKLPTNENIVGRDTCIDDQDVHSLSTSSESIEYINPSFSIEDRARLLYDPLDYETPPYEGDCEYDNELFAYFNKR